MHKKLVSVITWKMSFLLRPWTIFSSNWGYIIGFFWLCDWLVLISEPIVLVSTETYLHSFSTPIYGVKRGVAKANMETSTVDHLQLHFSKNVLIVLVTLCKIETAQIRSCFGTKTKKRKICFFVVWFWGPVQLRTDLVLDFDFKILATFADTCTFSISSTAPLCSFESLTQTSQHIYPSTI